MPGIIKKIIIIREIWINKVENRDEWVDRGYFGGCLPIPERRVRPDWSVYESSGQLPERKDRWNKHWWE